MSTPATVPIFDPQGVLRDVPYQQMKDAVTNGGMPAVRFQTPEKNADGSPKIRFVPANQTQDALSHGGKLLPFEQQDVKHPGFWSTLYDDVKGMASGAASSLDAAGKAMSGNPLPMATQAAQTAQTVSDNMQHRKDEGRSLAYRTIAPIGDTLGVNTRGMEDSADAGDVAGVAGHAAAVPALMVATEAAPFAFRLADSLSIPADSFAARGVRAAARGANAALQKAPGAIGGTVGGTIGFAAGHATGIPYAALAGEEIGRSAGVAAGKAVLPKLRVPGEGFGLPDAVTGGPASAPQFEVSPEAAQQSALDRLRNQPVPAAQPDYVPERPNIERVMPEQVAQPAASAAAPATEELAPPTPTVAAPPVAAPPATPKKFAPLGDLEKQINDALGGKPLQKGVSLKNQGKPNALPQGFTPVESSALKGYTLKNQGEPNALPQGFTPVESSALKGYRYDPAAQEFSAVTNNGQQYTHGEVTPDEVKAFEDADSQGEAWNTIRQNHVLVKQNGLPVKPSGARSVVLDPETGRPDFSGVVEAKQEPAQTTPAPQAKTAAAAPAPKIANTAAGEGDLTSLIQQSVEQAPAAKGGVFTSADPAELSKRWGVSGSSIADTDANLRGMNLKQSEDYVNKLAESYKKGQAVQPVLETRDANNNIVDVDGRHRALAAQKAGVKRIPIIVRRLGVQ